MCMKGDAQKARRDARAAARADAREQREQNALHEHQAGRIVGRHAGGKRRFRGIGLGEPAGLGSRHEVVTAPGAVSRGTVVAPASGRGIDEALVGRREVFIAESEFLYYPSTEIVHDDIGGGRFAEDREEAAHSLPHARCLRLRV